MSFPFVKSITCTKCGGPADHVFEGAPAVATSGMSQAPIDVVIGRDSEARWANIRQRQEKRDQIRRESGKPNLTMTGRNSFEANDKQRVFVETPEQNQGSVADLAEEFKPK